MLASLKPTECQPTAPRPAATIDGHLELCEFGEAGCSPVTRHAAHEESCRAVRCDAAGGLLLSCSADRSVCACDLAAAKVAARLTDAHGCGINRLELVGPALLATGDDEGHIKLWDTRARAGAGAWRVHKDFVSDLSFAAQHGVLLSVSGDGTLAKLDLAAGKASPGGGRRRPRAESPPAPVNPTHPEPDPPNPAP